MIRLLLILVAMWRKYNRVNNYNPIEKITELYERLLKEKDEKYAALERRLQNIEQSLQK